MTTVEIETVADTTGVRIRAWTRQSMRDVAYSGAVSVWSVAAFTVLVTGAAVTASLLVLVVGVLAWIGFVYAARWTTWVDRRLAGWQRHEPVPAVYRRPMGRGFVPYVKAVSSDPQTWRDLAWLAVTAVVGFVGGIVVVTGVGMVMAYVSMPLWYWAVTDPHTEYGLTNLGQFTVDTLTEAATMTAIGLVLVPLVLLLARRFATLHAGIAARLLSPVVDRTATDAGRSRV